MQFFDTGNDNGVSAMAADIRAHSDETLGEVNDFGLTRGVLYYRSPIGQAGSH